MTGDTITFAWPHGGSAALAKTIRVAGDRIVEKIQSKHVAKFRFVEHPVHDLRDLYRTVRRMAGVNAIAVRGKPKAR